jgi:hypothetical protein
MLIEKLRGGKRRRPIARMATSHTLAGLIDMVPEEDYRTSSRFFWWSFLVFTGARMLAHESFFIWPGWIGILLSVVIATLAVGESRLGFRLPNSENRDRVIWRSSTMWVFPLVFLSGVWGVVAYCWTLKPIGLALEYKSSKSDPTTKLD